MSIYKDSKRNTWYFRVYVEDNNGIKKQKCRSGFKTKAEAKQEELKFISSYNQNRANITFYELYKTYLKDRKQRLKLQSIKTIECRFETHILPYFKDYEIDKINNKSYIEWKEQIIAKNLSYRYKTSLHTSMVAILNYAMTFYDLEKNIASKVGNFSKNDFTKKVDFWTYDEFLQFINVVDDIVYYSFFSILYFTGMRLGECMALNWNDFKDGYIDINKSLTKCKNDNGNYILNCPKTYSSIRKIKLDEISINILNNLKQYYNQYIGFSNEWFIFGGISPLTRTTISRKKNDYCKIAKVKQIKIHDFRHSHATFLISNGVPITVISKRLGHSDISMTLNVYSHFIPQDEDKSISLINKINKEKNKIREF